MASYVPGDRVLARYQLMFKASTVMFGAAVVTVFTGLLAVVFAQDRSVLATGLLLGVASVLTGYKIALSTMKIIDDPRSDMNWRDLGL